MSRTVEVPKTALPVAPVTSPTVEDPPELLSLQRADEYCGPIIHYLTSRVPPPNSRARRQLGKFQLRHGTLHRRNHHHTAHKWLLVVPRSLRTSILEACHDDTTAGHLGFSIT